MVVMQVFFCFVLDRLLLKDEIKKNIEINLNK